MTLRRRLKNLPGLLLLSACALGICHTPDALAQAYSIVGQIGVMGQMVVQTAADGWVQVDYSYKQNGRGPDLRERFRLGPLDEPRDYEISGKSTFGAAVEERFNTEAGRLRWTSRIDTGNEAVAPGTLFLPLEYTQAYVGQLLRSLMSQPGQSAPVVGGHRLVLQRLATLSLPAPVSTPAPAPASPVGEPPQPLNLVLVALTGADGEPWYFWLRDDASHALFAQTYPGWTVVQQGFEALAPQLLARQQQAQDERLVALQQRLALPLQGLTLIRGVRWFDAPAAVMRGPADVWLFGDRISAVTAPGALQAQADRVIEGQGRTLLPGLFDMHGHLWPEQGLAHLAGGVTTVRDMGNSNATLMRLKARVDAGELPGPHIEPAGLIEGKSPFSFSRGVIADDLPAALAAVDGYAARGYRQIKLYNSVRPEWVKPLTQRAHALGLRVLGHVPAFMRAEEAVRAGYDELTHINQVMLNFVVRRGDDTRTLVRFTRVGEDARALDLKGAAAQAFLRLLRTQGTTVDPTLYAFESMFTQSQGQSSPSLVDIAGNLPAVWARGLKVADMDLEGDKLLRYRQSYQRMLDLTLAMHRAGVPLVAGTDGLAGLGLHRELALYVAAGIPAPHALRIATWNAARALRVEGQRGSIEPGKAADLVLIDGDPSVRISDLRRASLVIKGGVAYAPASIYEAIGFKPFVDAAALVAQPRP